MLITLKKCQRFWIASWFLMNFISTIITLFLITILAFSYNCVCDFFSWVGEKLISHHDKKWLMQSVSLFDLSFKKIWCPWWWRGMTASVRQNGSRDLLRYDTETFFEAELANWKCDGPKISPSPSPLDILSPAWLIPYVSPKSISNLRPNVRIPETMDDLTHSKEQSFSPFIGNSFFLFQCILIPLILPTATQVPPSGSIPLLRK